MADFARIAIADLPSSPLAAASSFHGAHVTNLLECAKGMDVITIILPPADHAHCAWRLAAVQELARAAAPTRVNAIVGTDAAGIARTADWLEQAAGVTGHVLTIEDPQ